MKFTPGIAVGRLSGSQGGTVASHNRYGPYFRLRSVPTNPSTVYQELARGRLGAASAAWQGLTAAQRAAWAAWAATNPIVNSFGERQVLAPNAAFIQLNSRRLIDSQAVITVPPVGAGPDALTSLTATWDIGAGDFEINFTATPLAAGEKLISRAAVVASPGITYVRNLMKEVDLSAAALASGYDLQSAIEARFGTLAIGQKVFIQCQVYEVASGRVSPPLTVSGTVVST